MDVFALLPGPEVFDPGRYAPATLVAATLGLAALILMIQAAHGLFSAARTQRLMNRRLKFKERAASTSELIVELRRQRALNEDGEFKLAFRRFNELVTRSGLPFQPIRWIILDAVVVVGLAALLSWRSGLCWLGPAVAPVLFVCLPMLVLKMAGGRRRAKIAKQLPDALQIVVRSLEAGHPVPTAISLVAREMPDPVGSEFGMAADEMAYGMSLTKAVERLALRAGDPDVELFAATVRLQERTGGNLCDLLTANVDTIRERQTLRLKVKAASSEGRASAMILTAAPFIVMGAVYLLKPDFYGDVWHAPLMQYSLIGFGIWMFIGNVIMNRMINFKF